jgi:hypothetical protein
VTPRTASVLHVNWLDRDNFLYFPVLKCMYLNLLQINFYKKNSGCARVRSETRLISLGTVKWRASVSFTGYGLMAGFSIFRWIRSNGGVQYLSLDTV